MRSSNLLRLLPALALAISLAACGDDDEDIPPDGGPSIRDLGPDQGPSDGGELPDLSVDGGGIDAEVLDGGALDGDVPDAGSCLGSGGCWSCAPTTPTHFLNGCTSAECSPFDNEARLPLLNPDGTLPALP